MPEIPQEMIEALSERSKGRCEFVSDAHNRCEDQAVLLHQYRVGPNWHTDNVLALCRWHQDFIYAHVLWAEERGFLK